MLERRVILTAADLGRLNGRAGCLTFDAVLPILQSLRTRERFRMRLRIVVKENAGHLVLSPPAASSRCSTAARANGPARRTGSASSPAKSGRFVSSAAMIWPRLYVGHRAGEQPPHKRVTERWQSVAQLRLRSIVHRHDTGAGSEVCLLQNASHPASVPVEVPRSLQSPVPTLAAAVRD